MQWCKPKRISTGFPIVKISFFFSWFIALSLAHWDASAIRPITFGTVPARLVHCTAPEPLALLIHGTLSSLHQGLAVPLYYLLSFSSVLPLKQGNTPNVCHSDDSKPLFPCSLVRAFLPCSLLILRENVHISHVVFTFLGMSNLAFCQVSQFSCYLSILSRNCSMFATTFLFQSPPKYLFIFQHHRK